MASDPSDPQVDFSETAWHEIDDLVDKIAELSRSSSSATEFYSALLERVVSALAATGGAVWTLGPQGHLHLEYHVNLPEPLVAEGSPAGAQHRQIVQFVLQTGEARLVAPQSGPIGDEGVLNPTRSLLVLSPWREEDVSTGVIELFQRPGASPRARRGYLRFLSAVCELVVDYHRNRQLRGFRRRVAQWGRFEQFVQRVHASLDLRSTAYQIANEGRRLAGCDRVSVAVRRGSKCRLLAVSGVDKLNRRANAVRHLERLATAVVTVDEPLWYPEQAERLASQLEELVHAYLDEAHVRTLAVLPLKQRETGDYAPRSRGMGALVAEWFHGDADEDVRAGVDAVCVHASSAIRNALELQEVPLVRPMQLLGKLTWFFRGRQFPKVLLLLMAVTAAVAALVVVPADFEVEARGELQPLELRDVFAPNDGAVDELRTAHGSDVRTGDVLAVLRRPELDLQFQQVRGSLQTAQSRLATVEAERLLNPRETEEDQRRHSQLAAEEEELRELVRSLRRQYEIVRAQQAQLEIRSPLDGQVLTWDLEQLLEARPVKRGDVLMSVGRLDGPWVLELEVPDDDIAYIRKARQEMGPELDVKFVLATDPGVTYEGKLDEVALRTEITESDESIVRVTVGVDHERIAERAPGAGVVARIHCGRRSVGYVWLHDLIEAVRSRIAF